MSDEVENVNYITLFSVKKIKTAKINYLPTFVFRSDIGITAASRAWPGGARTADKKFSLIVSKLAVRLDKLTIAA